MTVYSAAVSSTGAGGTADTFDNVGTVTLRDEATKVLGAWIVAAPVTSTAAEAVHGQVRITMSGAFGQETFPAPPYMGGPPASNVGFRAVVPEFIPFVHDVDGGEDVVIDYSTHVQDPTGANAVVACVVYVAGKADPGQGPAEIMANWPHMAPISGGGDSEARGQTLTVAESAITDLVIPNGASEIVGFKQAIVPDLMTAGEEIIGFVRYRSTIGDFTPQEWPLNAWGAPLGTPVGNGAYVSSVPPLAGFVKTPGSRATISPFVVLVAAVTTGHSVSASVFYR